MWRNKAYNVFESGLNIYPAHPRTSLAANPRMLVKPSNSKILNLISSLNIKVDYIANKF